MAEYIDREALLEKRWDVPFETGNAHFVQVVDVGDILDAPVADVAPVRHGRWITYLDGDRLMPEQYYKCSICGDRGYRFRVNYCPNCGAKMDGERKERAI